MTQPSPDPVLNTKQPTAAAVKPMPPHKHPRDMRRHIVYAPSCQACRRLDDERAPVPAEDLERTIFLVPEFIPEKQISTVYLQQRYGEDTDLIIRDKFDLKLMARLMKAQIVVVVRRSRGGKPVKSHVRFEHREDGRQYEVQIPHVELIGDIIESAPIPVSDCVDGPEALGMFDEAMLDTAELIERLQEVAVPFRVAAPNPPDSLVKIKFT